MRVRVNNTLEPGTLVAKIGAAKQDSASSYGTKELNIKKVKITVNGETLPETLVAAVGTERDIVSDKLKDLQEKMFQQMESAQTGMDDAPKVLDVTSDIIRIAEGYTYDDLSDQQKLLVGYNQTANPPPSVYEQPEEYHNVITEFQGRIDTFKNTMKISNLKTLDGRDIEEILNLWSLPYDIDPITGQIVFNLLNYETLSEHLSLNGKHAFRAYRSSGILRSSTPALICANLTLELFLQTICGDVYPYAYPKDTDPLDFMSERVHSYMMRAYVEILLRPAAEDKRIVMAIGSKSTGKTFAKHVYNGGLKELFEVYNMDPTLWISASDGKLDFNNHPESLYNLLYCIYMLVKCQKNDEFATNERRVIDPNADPCTFAMGIFEEGSAIFELVMQNHLDLCRLGGANSAKAKAIAVISYHVLLQESMTPADALEYIEQCMRPEDRGHVDSYLKFEAMAKLSALHADMVDMKEVEATAKLLGMRVNDLLDNVEACRKGRSKMHAHNKLAYLQGTNKRHGKTWRDKLEELKQYQDVEGDTIVPTNHALSDWVINQRNYYKLFMEGKDAKGMTQERINELNDIDFIWDAEEYKWDKKYDELDEFKDGFGHCNVPKEYQANKPLGNWASRQRGSALYTKENKTERDLQRIEKLTRIGFVFEQPRVSWEERLDELDEFKDEFGHCNVPKDYHANKPLGNWVNKQRGKLLYKKKVKSQKDLERIEKLTRIGFVFEPPRGGARR